MRKTKRLFSLLLIAAMLVGMMQFATFAVTGEATAGTTQTFSDMPDNWARAALENAAANGLLVGSGGRIRPNDNLTRAEMAAVIVRAFGATTKADISGFKDVSPNKWYADSMAKAVQMGVLLGSNGKLDPERNITRQEVFVILARAFKLKPAETMNKTFKDSNEISDWAKGEVHAVVNAGYVAGSNGYLNPQSFITRAEFAKVLDNFVKQYIKTSGEYTTVANGNVMINTPNVTLKNVTVTGDLIIGDGVGDGDVILNNVTVTGRTVVRGGGVNSIRIIGNSNLQNIIVARVDGKIRIYAEDGAEIGEIIADGKDDVIIEGDVGAVTILADDITVTTNNADIGSLVVEGTNVEVVAGTGSKITKVEVNSDGASISGTGTVTSVAANANNVKVTTTNTQVTAAAGTTGVVAGTTPVQPGTTTNTTVIPPAPPSSYEPTPTPTIDIEFSNSIVLLGETGATPNIIRSNPPASELTITYESSNPEIVSIDKNTGEMTAVTDGEVTITATVSRSGYQTKVVTFKATVWTEEEVANAEIKELKIGFSEGDSAESVCKNIILPVKGAFGSDISWATSDNTVIAENGTVTRKPTDTEITLTATLVRGSTTKTKTFTVTVIGDIALADKLAAEADLAALQIGFAEGESYSIVKNNLTLPTAGANGSTITWASSDASISNTGVVTRPKKPASDQDVTLTATITKGATTLTTTFNVTVIAYPTDEESLEYVQPEDFGPGNWSGVIGYNVGFRLEKFTSANVSSIEVSLYKGEKLLATNISKPEIKDLNTHQISSPFNVTGTYDTDDCWVLGEWQGRADDVPDKAVIMVTDDQNNLYTIENTSFTGDPSIVYTFVNDDASSFVVAENFNTYKGIGYRGVNVGFKLVDLEISDLNSVEVSLFAGETRLVTNTANSKFMELDAKQHSTPFIVKPGSYEEEYWNLGTETLAIDKKPTKAEIKIVDKFGCIYIVENSNLVEPNGWTWDSLFDELTVSISSFGSVLNHSGVIGYALDFVSNETMSFVNKVEIKLYNGSKILGTITSNKALANYPGLKKLTASFDVLGTVDYAASENWTYSGWQGEVTDIPDKAEVTLYFKDGTNYSAVNTKPVTGKLWAAAKVINIDKKTLHDDLQDAINKADAGNTLLVNPGDHNIGETQLVLNKAITLKGVGKTKPVIKGTAFDVTGYTEPMLITTAWNTGEQKTVIDNLFFEWKFKDGFTVKGNGNAAMLAGNNIEVTNCEFRGINIPSTQYPAIVSIGQSGGNTPNAGIQAGKITFRGNSVYGTISIVRSSDGNVLDAEIINNTIDPVNMEGIWTYVLSSDDKLTIIGNTIKGLPFGYAAIKLMERVYSVNDSTEYTRESISAANNGASVVFNWVTDVSTVEELKAAITVAKAGDVISLAAGDYTITETITINKAITLKGAPGFATRINTSGGKPVFTLSAAATLDGIFINKSDKSNQHLVTITSHNAVVRNCKFIGNYVQGDSEVVRAIVANAGINGYVFDGNHFESVRQPSYLQGAGTVTNNFVKNTRGWVVCEDYVVHFAGNTFEDNAVDIAIIAPWVGAPMVGSYPDIAALSEANNGAYVEHQMLYASAKNGALVVDANGSAFINSIQKAINAAQPGDTIYVGEGEYYEDLRIEKPVELVGAGIGKSILNAKDSNTKRMIILGNERNYGLDLSGTIITGFTINSPEKKEKDICSIYLTATGSTDNKITIHNNEFKGQYEGRNSDEQGIGIVSPHSASIGHVIIMDNTFSNLKYGMYFNGLNNSRILNNVIDGTRYGGIVIAYSATNNNRNHEIRGNTLVNISWTPKDLYDNPLYDSGICIGYNVENVTVMDNSIDVLEGKLPIYFDFEAFAGNEEELLAALSNPNKRTIYITGNIEISKTIAISRAVNIKGNNKSIIVTSVLGEDNSSKHAINIYAKGVIINDLTINNDKKAFGVQAYGDADAFLNNVVIKDSLGAGLTVNGSRVEAENLTTIGSVWGGVNVDPGKNVKTPSIFVLRSGTINETPLQIWSDGRNVTNDDMVSVTAEGYTETRTTEGYRLWTNRDTDTEPTTPDSITMDSFMLNLSLMNGSVDDPSSDDLGTENLRAQVYAIVQPRKFWLSDY